MTPALIITIVLLSIALLWNLICMVAYQSTEEMDLAGFNLAPLALAIVMCSIALGTL